MSDASVVEVGVVGVAAFGLGGAGGCLPVAKSSPHTSQNRSSGARSAPQLEHRDPLVAAVPDPLEAGEADAFPVGGAIEAPHVSQ
jgi:hypothetical protein